MTFQEKELMLKDMANSLQFCYLTDENPNQLIITIGGNVLVVDFQFDKTNLPNNIKCNINFANNSRQFLHKKVISIIEEYFGKLLKENSFHDLQLILAILKKIDIDCNNENVLQNLFTTLLHVIQDEFLFENCSSFDILNRICYGNGGCFDLSPADLSPTLYFYSKFECLYERGLFPLNQDTCDLPRYWKDLFYKARLKSKSDASSCSILFDPTLSYIGNLFTAKYPTIYCSFDDQLRLAEVEANNVEEALNFIKDVKVHLVLWEIFQNSKNFTWLSYDCIVGENIKITVIHPQSISIETVDESKIYTDIASQIAIKSRNLELICKSIRL